MSSAVIEREALEAAVRRRADGGLDGLRSAALARFLASGLPCPSDERWKYTSLERIAATSATWLAEHAPTESAPLPRDVIPDDVFRLRIENGRVADGALASLNEQLGADAAALRLSDADSPGDIFLGDAVASLNAALMQDAICINVADGASVAQPILLDVSDASAETSHLRLLVSVGDGARLDIVEINRSSGSTPRFASVVAEIALGSGASANYGRIQARAESDSLLHRTNAALGRDSQFRHAAIDLGGLLVRNDVVFDLSQPGARAESSGLFIARGEQHIDNHVLADHRVGPSFSTQHYRGIADDRARCVFNGKALVREGADGTDAGQSSHNLLLSDRAEIDTKPELEIYAEDVKCNHGATVGQLDDRALFYLRSRGIDRHRARQILVRAFAGSLLSEFPVAGFDDYLEQLVGESLDGLTGEGA